MSQKEESDMLQNRYNVKSALRLLTCFCIVLLFITQAFAHTPTYQILPDTINKSERDKRQYQAIKLPNQMTVLLVSDPFAVKSLGALALPVGSLQDPTNQQGLAHYTEHMVLMGSQAFPEPDGFSEFLSKHAGSYNASTAAYRTAYYFEVENSALEAALQRLSDAIARPLLDPLYADKERNAVNAEMTLARSRDGFRIGQVDAETINQAHPAAMFSGGNLETLSDKPDTLLQDALVHFYQHYYSANLMVGVIYGQPELSQLAALAVNTFGHINNHDANVEPITIPAITKNEMAKLIYLTPAQSKRLLYMQFPIENNLAQFADKSDEYIGYLISNRSEGTLADKLQKSGLIDSISAGHDPNRYGNSGVFTIAINLTEQGLAKKDDVIAAVLSYIQLLKEQGINQAYYDEITHVLTLDFAHQSVTRDMDYVEWLVDQMLAYPLKHILDADYITAKFDEEAIVDRLSYLTSEHARIWVIAPDQPHDKEAFFIKAPYSIADFTPAQTTKWQNAAGLWSFTLPEINPFIPDNFSLVPPPKVAAVPTAFSPQGNVLHFASHYFADEPKAALVLSLRQNHILDETKDQVLFKLVDYLAGRSMAQLSFQAEVAGMSLNSGTDNGLMLTAIGFSQHLSLMINTMLDKYRTFTINEDDVLLAKSWYLQQLSAADNVNSYSLALQPIQALNQLSYSEREARRQVLSTISVADITTYRHRLLNKSVPYLFALGNYDDAQLATLYADVTTSLANHADFVMPERMAINSSRKALIEQTATSSDNALAVVYLPKQSDELTSKANSLLLSKIIYPWFYQQLRSEEQLGYAVFNFPVNIGQSFGIGFLIQSNQYDSAYLYQRYLAFYPQALEKLNAMTKDDFLQYRDGLLSELQEPPQTLNEELGLYLSDFLASRFSFDTREALINKLSNVTQDELIAFYQSTVLEGKGLSIASSVMGENSQVVLKLRDYQKYNNASDLQQVLQDDAKEPLNNDQ